MRRRRAEACNVLGFGWPTLALQNAHLNMVRLEVQRSSMRNVWSSDSDTSNLRLPSSLCACRACGPWFSGRHVRPAAPAAHLNQAADGRSAPAKYGSLLCEEAGQCMRYC